jgi:hypothetical protein
LFILLCFSLTPRFNVISDKVPGLMVLIPVLCTMCVILCASEKNFLGKLLCIFPLPQLGIISYSLYLWHFPIFILAKSIGFYNELYQKFLLVIVIIILSVFSYLFIERPFRDYNFINTKKFLLSILLIITAIIIYNINYIYLHSKVGIYQTLSKSNKKYTLDIYGFGYDWSNDRVLIGETNFPNNSKKNILVVGNSHSTDTYRSLIYSEKVSNQFNLAIVHPKGEYNLRNMVYQLDCFLSYLKMKNNICKDHRGKIAKYNLKNKFEKADFIVISTRYRDIDLVVLPEILTIIKKLGKRIIIFTNNIEMKSQPIRQFIRENNRFPTDIELELLEKKTYNLLANHYSIKKINKGLERISKDHKVPLFYKHKLFCNDKEKRCKIYTKDRILIHGDSSHYSLAGAKYIGEQNNQKLSKVFNLSPTL